MIRILLAEDSRFLRLATERALARAGYDVCSAVDGEEAVRLAREIARSDSAGYAIAQDERARCTDGSEKRDFDEENSGCDHDGDVEGKRRALAG